MASDVTLFGTYDPDPARGHYASCDSCGWHADFAEEEQAKRAAVWHVHDEHPRTWLEIVGERPPLDPRPDVPL